MRLNKQVPRHRQFKRDIHQKRNEVGKPCLLRPKRSYQDHGEVPKDQYSQQDLSYKSEWREGIDIQTFPIVLESFPLPGHGVRNWRQNLGNFAIALVTEIDKRTTETPCTCPQTMGKKRPLGGSTWSGMEWNTLFGPKAQRWDQQGRSASKMRRKK